jgi:hypothetical protein
MKFIIGFLKKHVKYTDYAPWTLKTFIYNLCLNLDFFLGMNFSNVNCYFYIANVVVHEWGHLRWGLWDEYATKKTGRFYMKDGGWKPVG